MILLVNTVLDDRVIFGVAPISQTFKRGKTPLVLLDIFLKRHSISLTKLTGIIICDGPGRFSSVRQGITMANAIAFSLNIPITGVHADEWDKILKSHYVFEKKFFSAVMPYYDKEPNITVK